MNRFEESQQKTNQGKELRRQSRTAKPSVENMEQRELLAAPAMDAINQINVPGGKSLFVPLTSTTSDQTSVTYSVESSTDKIQTTVLGGGTFINMKVAGYGDLTFKLFDTLTPDTVGKIKSLVQSGFYNGLTFHRVIKNFVVQGGDPKGNGTGGPGFSFDDEFSPNAIYSGTGQLAMANSGKDTNGSQFFITSGPQRALDFNNPIFGQLVRGFDVLNTIQNANTNNSDAPLTPIVISSATVVQDNTDAVLLVNSSQAGASGQLTIRATASDGEFSQQTVPVSSYTDTVNDPPILGKISDVTTQVNQPVTFRVPAIDLENNNLELSVVATTNVDQVTIQINGSDVTITPKTGFTGNVGLTVGVREVGATARGSTPNPWDTQNFKLTVSPPPVTVNAVKNQQVEGQNVGSLVVGWFTDTANPNALASDYGASIEWGDGTASVGTIRPRVGGGFEILGSHAYANEGTYTTTVRVGARGEDGSAASTVALGNGQFVATDAPLAAKGTTPTGVVAGSSWTGVVATFVDTNPNSPVSDYTALIRWGDGSIENATQIVKNSAGVIEVYGEHTYATPGRKVSQILIRDLGTSSTTAVTPIQIGSAAGITPQPAPTTQPISANTGSTTTNDPASNASLPPSASSGPDASGPLDTQTSGRLSATSDTGISSDDGITRNNLPTFDGQTSPGATVQLVATNQAGTSEPIILGQTTAGADGRWVISTSTHLADGTYTVVMNVNRGTDQLNRVLMGNATGAGSSLVIDTVAPQISQVGYNISTGQIRINVQDFGSGIDRNSFGAAGNYQVMSLAGRNAGQIINPATFRMVSTTSYPEVTYNMILDRRSGPRPRRVQLSLNTAHLSDSAGNTFEGQSTYVLTNSRIIGQLPKGVAATIMNSRKDTSLANKILNWILPTGARTPRF